MLLLLTSRSTSTLPAAQQQFLAELRRSETVTELRLRPLPDDAVRRLISALGDQDADQTSRIVRLADGIPFYAVHLARSASDELPAQLAEVLRASTAAVADADRPLLVQVAIAGAVPEADLIEAHGTAVTDHALHRLGAAGMVSVDNGVVRCRHALVRETLLATSLPGERRAAHELSARTLLRHPVADPAAVAHHLRGAGQNREAAPFVRRAAANAAAVTAFETAFVEYSWLADHWPDVPGPDADRRRPPPADVLLAAPGPPGGAAGRPRAWRCSTRVDLAQSSKGTAAAVEQTRGDLLAAGGDHAAAMAAYERAGALAGGPTDRRQAAVLGSLARLLMTAGNAVAAAAAAQRAVQVARLRGAEPERVAAAITLGVTHCQLGDPTRGIAELEAALADARALDDLELVLRGYGNLTYALGSERPQRRCRRHRDGRYRVLPALRPGAGSGVDVAHQPDRGADRSRPLERGAHRLPDRRGGGDHPGIGDAARRPKRRDERCARRSRAAASALDAAGEADGGNVYALSAVASIRCEIARAGGDTRGAQRIAAAVLPVLEARRRPRAAARRLRARAAGGSGRPGNNGRTGR